MRPAPIALALLSALSAAAVGCGRNQGLPPVPHYSGVAEDSHSRDTYDTNPREDPGRYPVMGDREPN